MLLLRVLFHKELTTAPVLIFTTGSPKVFNAVPSTIFATCHISSCRLQWRVTAVMLADTLERYRQQEKSLVSDFEKLYPGNFHGMVENDTHGSLVQWVERFSPRRYGCSILLDIFFNPI